MTVGALNDDAVFTIVLVGFVVFVLFVLLMIRMSAWAVVVATILGALAGAIVGYSSGESIAPCDFTLTECIGPSDGAILGGSIGLLIGALLGSTAAGVAGVIPRGR